MSENSLPTPPAQGNTAFVLHSVKHTSFEERPIQPLHAGEVRVNVRQTGLCGSDCHYRSHGRIGDFVLTAPMVLGHESSGIVSEVGEGVTTHKVGDRVALEPGDAAETLIVCSHAHLTEKPVRIIGPDAAQIKSGSPAGDVARGNPGRRSEPFCVARAKAAAPARRGVQRTSLPPQGPTL